MKQKSVKKAKRLAAKKKAVKKQRAVKKKKPAKKKRPAMKTAKFQPKLKVEAAEELATSVAEQIVGTSDTDGTEVVFEADESPVSGEEIPEVDEDDEGYF